MWIDTHCHLDADAFDADRAAVVARARAGGVGMVVIPAAHVDHFAAARAVAHEFGFAYALGIHPLWVERSTEADVARLGAAIAAAQDDPRLVAVGEIGLDYFIADPDIARQQWFYREQLRLARAARLPVIVHVRRSADALLKELNRWPVPGGIVHAFNGSLQQASRFIERGFCLGFGGAATYAGSRRIRALAATLPAAAIVVETDAPDIPPAWLRQSGSAGTGTALRNEPGELPRIAAEVAALRGLSALDLASLNTRNALRVLPRLAALLAPPLSSPAPLPATAALPKPAGSG
jgi:TatD DNase family protein